MRRSSFYSILCVCCLFVISFSSFYFIQDITNFNLSSSSLLLPDHSTPSSNNSRNSLLLAKQNYISFHEQQYPLIAFVKPVFTTAAYNGFYTVYSIPTISNPRSYLVQLVPNQWEIAANASDFISALISDGYPYNRITIINDITVHSGKLFNIDGTPKYDILVFFHNEYVTMNEYKNTITFIKAGGNVILLNGNSFYAEVDYNSTANAVTLVYGHGWQFDGQNVTKANTWRFSGTIIDRENFDWLGSESTIYSAGPTYGAYFRTNSSNPHPIAVEMLKLGYSAIAQSYISHEENTLITRNVHIIADWRTSFKQPDYGLKIYEMFPDGPYGGSLIHFGFFGTDILPLDYASRLAFVVAIKHQMGYYADPWIRYPMDGAILRGHLIIDYTNSWQTETYLNGKSLGYIPPKTDLGLFPEGEYNLTIIFKSPFDSINRTVRFSIDRTPPKIVVQTGSNTSLLLNYPAQPIQIQSYDLHPYFLRIDASSALTPNYLSKISVLNQQSLLRTFSTYSYGSGPVTTSNITYPFSNGTWFFNIIAFDAAGNVDTSSFTVGINTFSNITDIIQPIITKLNETTACVVIPKVGSNYIAFLQTTINSGRTWSTTPFTNDSLNSNESIAYLTRNPRYPEVWFRIGLRNATSLTYVPYIRTYQWENTVVGISYTNLTKNVNSSNSYFVVFKTSQLISGNISTLWMNRQSVPVYESTQTFLANISRYTFTIPQLGSGQYTLHIFVFLPTMNMSFSFNLEVNPTNSIPKPLLAYVYLNASIFGTGTYTYILRNYTLQNTSMFAIYTTSNPSNVFWRALPLPEVELSLVDENDQVVIIEKDSSLHLLRTTYYFINMLNQFPSITIITPVPRSFLLENIFLRSISVIAVPLVLVFVVLLLFVHRRKRT